MASSWLIVKVEPFYGQDTFLSCGLLNEQSEMIEQPLYLIANTATGVVVDYGYRSLEEASQAWPEAANAIAQE